MAKRYFLILIGWLSIVVGTIGIFLPILPTTPFILLAAWCFARSSQHFHHWLISNRFFGPMVRDWEAGKGIPLTVRYYALCMLWVSLLGSMWLVGTWWSVIILVSCGLFASHYIASIPIKQK
jgi:uncharacterized membrane protein YbaN (DUF454 family)